MTVVDPILSKGCVSCINYKWPPEVKQDKSTACLLVVRWCSSVAVWPFDLWWCVFLMLPLRNISHWICYEIWNIFISLCVLDLWNLKWKVHPKIKNANFSSLLWRFKSKLFRCELRGFRDVCLLSNVTELDGTTATCLYRSHDPVTQGNPLNHVERRVLVGAIFFLTNYATSYRLTQISPWSAQRHTSVGAVMWCSLIGEKKMTQVLSRSRLAIGEKADISTAHTKTIYSDK